MNAIVCLGHFVLVSEDVLGIDRIPSSHGGPLRAPEPSRFCDFSGRDSVIFSKMDARQCVYERDAVW